MLTQNFHVVSRIFIAGLFSVGVSTAGLSQGPSAQPTPAQRQRMGAMHKQVAEMHLKMAACLESEKAPSQCRQEMQDACTANFGGSCPMLGMGMGKMGGRGKNAMRGGSCMDWMTTAPTEAAAPAKQPPVK